MSRFVISSQSPPFTQRVKELIQYKDLLWTLTYRDFRVRYAQTALGLIWAFIQPFFTLLIFILVFGKVLKIETGIPYPLFILSGMALWNYFAYVMTQSGTSIIGSQAIISKIYFPRLIIPVSKAIVGLIDLGIVLFLLLACFIYYGVIPSERMVFMPLILIFSMACSLGIGILLSSLSIRFRDFQHVIPFLVQLGLYATPIAYPISLVPTKYQWIAYVNPMAGIIESFRWSILGLECNTFGCAISYLSACTLFTVGLVVFFRTEKTLADWI